MKNSQSAEWPEKGLQPTCVCVRSTAMLLLSNSPHCVHGVNTSHLINITVDVMQSNQKVKLSWCYLARVQMLQLCASFHKNMTHSSDKDVPDPQTCAACQYIARRPHSTKQCCHVTLHQNAEKMYAKRSISGAIKCYTASVSYSDSHPLNPVLMD